MGFDIGFSLIRLNDASSASFFALSSPPSSLSLSLSLFLFSSASMLQRACEFSGSPGKEQWLRCAENALPRLSPPVPE
jgi:hypothetical protein